MPDFRVADTAPEHPKLRAAGLAAVGLWAAAGAYAMRELTDGWVPEYWVTTWPTGARQAATLVRVGLWRKESRHGIAGYAFHDWTGYQRPASKIREDRERARERAAKSRGTSAARAPARNGNVQAKSHDSLALALALPPGGSVGGEASSTERDTTHNGPPTANLDPNNPRCADHADIPATDRGPNCRACGAVRASLELAGGERADADRQARAAWRAAVDACHECDENGKLELPDGSLARHHEAATVAS